MDIVGSTYLYTLATLSTTLVGFTAVVVMFRQVLGGRMTRFDSFLMRTFLLLGVMVTAAAMLPPLLGLWRLDDRSVWRIASIVFAVSILLFVFVLPSRRRVAAGGSMPIEPKMFITISLIAAAGLMVNAAGLVGDPGVGLYATALSTIFTVFGLALAYVLGLLHRHATTADPAVAEPK
jgi:hypothetical protein